MPNDHYAKRLYAKRLCAKRPYAKRLYAKRGTIIQEIRWPRTGERGFRAVDPIANTSFKYHIYYSGGDRAERGVGLIVIGKQMKRIIRWKPVSDRICVLRMKGKFFNYSLISIYAPTNDKPDDMKDEFYESLDKAYGECPKQDVKIVIGDANAQIGKEDFFRPVIGTESLHSVTNDNGLRLVTFAAGDNRVEMPAPK